MPYKTILFILIVSFIACQQEAEVKTNLVQNSTNMTELIPKAVKVRYSYPIHDQEIVDQYHWMRLTDEQKNSTEPDTQTVDVLNYLKAENSYKDSMMSHLKPLQEELFDEIVGRIKKDDNSVPYFKNGFYYSREFKDGKEYAIHKRNKETIDGAETTLLDENILAKDQDYFAIGTYSVSSDNNWLAYSQDTVSRRVYEIKFKNLESEETLDYSISGTSGQIVWAEDNKTVFYVLKDEKTLLPYKVMRHTLGTDPSTDQTVYTEKDNTFYTSIFKTSSKEHIVIGLYHTVMAEFRTIDASKPTSQPKVFMPREMNHEHNIDHYDGKFYIRTNKGAKNFRLVSCPENATSPDNWTDIIPASDDVLVENFNISKDFIAVEERIKGIVNIKIIDSKTNNQHHIDFGEDAYMAYLGSNAEASLDYIRIGFTSMTVPNSVMDYYPATKKLEVRKEQEVVGGYNKDEYASERLYAKVRDGVEVPISLVYKKGTKLDGSSPLLLYAYGSYGNSMDPYFSSVRLSLLDRGFVYAIAHIRGGMELGKDWYEDGKMLKKMNTFNDYIDCGKFLVAEKYTSTENLYGMGGSAGGLLMGAVINMEPSLFNGIIAAVPFVDVINTMLDESIPLTTGEFHEWGNPKEKPYFDYMMSYSPYDNVKAQDYPSMLVTTGLHDSQVQYWEPAKWVAKLREFKTDMNPLLFHIEMEAGHGGASGRFKRYRETAMEYSFLLDLANKTK